MKKWHRMGICLVLALSLLVLPACTQPATETAGTTDASTTNTIAKDTPPEPTKETIPADIAYYQILYPQCADLSLENGLEISVWHRASGEGAGYYCDFLPEREDPYTLDEAYELDKSAVPMEIMRKIVGYYIDTGAITKELVTLKCADMPSFSVNDHKADYIQGLVDYYFWADEAIFQYVNTQSRIENGVYYMDSKSILDLATYDIDGDGALEQIALFPGRWGSRRCIELMVCKDGAAECWNEFTYSVAQNLSWDITLEETNQGTVQIVVSVRQRADMQSDYVPTGQQYRFDLAVTDGNIVLLGDTEQFFTYHGTQGPENAYWPKQ